MSKLRFLVIVASLVSAQASAQATNNPHGDLRESCSTCHRADGWKPVQVSRDFRHAPGKFELDGAHLTTSCMSCHRRLDFKGTTSSCSSCHQDVHNAELGADCARCHTTRSFVDRAGMERAHERTRFPLRGAHATAPCEACHAPSSSGTMRFVNRPSSCISCHATAFTATRNPDHQGAGFSRECAACHTINSWSGAAFDHSRTTFKLTGAHGAVSCAGCHADNVFRGKSSQCVSCHQADYDRAIRPAHAGFPTACADCHATAEWAGAKFDHQTTRFPLTGGHQVTSCASCHRDGIYSGTSTDCISCHRTAYERTTTPPHAAAGFGTVCSSCHTTTRWPGVAYDHATTRFPLTGAHIPVACSGCHGDGVYTGKSLDCYSCHRAKYDQAANPPHLAAGFPTTCATCHNTTAWPGATFNHSATRFALTGAHQAVPCNACHADAVYRGKSTDCYSCHRTSYEGTRNPPHAAASFGLACTNCHTTTTWLGAVFNHSATQFPLTGAHFAAACASCHSDGIYDGKSTDCYSCHRARYDQSSNPPHAAAGFPTTCATCHNTSTWPGAIFDHAATRFALTGAHRAVPCNACHADAVYRGKSTDCYSCHRATYEGTRNPPHASAGFGLVCTNCHTTTAWPGAVFNHSATQFPLTGAHTATTCISCHGDGVYNGKSTDCYSCHSADYTRSTSPNHSAAGFPTSCISCHTTTTWLGATFNHDASWFPIYSGKHSGRWTSCAQCHPSSSDFRQFTCLTCHEHNKIKMDDTHKDKAGYRYESLQCYACHPRP